MSVWMEMAGADVSPSPSLHPSMGFEEFRRPVLREGQRETVSVYQDRHVIVWRMLVGLEEVDLRLEHHLSETVVLVRVRILPRFRI